MNPTSTVEVAVALTERQKMALVNLLGDEDPAVYQTIRARIISCGQSSAEWLRPHLLSPEPVLRRRAQEIIDYFARQDCDTAFLSFCLRQGEDFEIEDGIWLLARTQYPNINVAAYREMLDSYAGDLRERIDFNDPSEQTLATINQLLFAELGFGGNDKNYYDPENSYLNRVMDRRTGNPISLCLVYLLLARRLRLPVVGIGLPGHFVCRFQSVVDELYIDVFNKGKLLSKANCVKYLLHTQHSLADGHLVPMSARRMLLRVCTNLHQIYLQNNFTDESARLQRYVVVLAR